MNKNLATPTFDNPERERERERCSNASEFTRGMLVSWSVLSRDRVHSCGSCNMQATTWFQFGRELVIPRLLFPNTIRRWAHSHDSNNATRSRRRSRHHNQRGGNIFGQQLRPKSSKMFPANVRGGRTGRRNRCDEKFSPDVVAGRMLDFLRVSQTVLRY